MQYVSIPSVGLMRFPLCLPRERVVPWVEGFEVIEPEPFTPSPRWEKSYKARKVPKAGPALKDQPVPTTFRLFLAEGWSENVRESRAKHIAKLTADCERAGVEYSVVGRAA